MTWPAYPEYREADVNWLGAIPTSWSIERMSWLFNDISSGTTPESGNLDFYDGDINWVTTGELREKGVSQTQKKVTRSALATYSALKIYPAGTLLIAMYGATIGRLGWLDAPACTNQACCAFANPKRISTRFAYYALTAARDHLILLASGGGQPNINQDKLRSLRIAVPSRPEQAVIVDFLDRETAKIDALIAKQEQLIATLREDRTATITDAVTRGLDPSVEIRETGSEWLAAVPRHWSTSRLKWLTSLITSGSRGWAQYYADEGDYFVRIGNLCRGSLGFDDSDVNFVQVPPGAEGSRTITRDGDLLFSITAYLGSVAVVDQAHSSAYVSQHVSLVRLISGQLDPMYAGYAALSEVGQRQLKENAYGGTKSQLSLGDIGDLELPLPPVPEQRRIVEFLHERCSRIDILIAKAAEVIETLREYRSALIADAVTGKIDVRRAVA